MKDRTSLSDRRRGGERSLDRGAEKRPSDKRPADPHHAGEPARPAERPATEGRGKGRYWDPDFKAMAVKVLPGEHVVTRDPGDMLVTVLGSCVSACVRDPVAQLGGMNHFMLPGEARPGAWGEANNGMRYGQFAMEQLINDLLRMGARRDRLEIKLFGGANVLQSSMKIGDNNAEFARSFVRDEKLHLVSEDLGGGYARRIHYFPMTGKVFRLELKREPDREVFGQELSYREQLRKQQLDGSVELFD